MPLQIDWSMLLQMLQLIEPILSFVGLYAIARFLFEWQAKYTSKQKELTDLDKETRSLLKEQIEAHKSLRDIDRELLSGQLSQMKAKYAALGKVLLGQIVSLAHLHKRSVLVDIVGGAIREWGKEIIDRTQKESIDHVTEVVAILVKEGEIDQEEATKIISEGFKGGTTPEKPMAKIVYQMASQTLRVFVLTAELEIASSIIPTVLERFDQDPQQPSERLFALPLDTATSAESHPPADTLGATISSNDRGLTRLANG